MATAGAIARWTEREKGLWAGVVHEYDAYPTGLGVALWDAAMMYYAMVSQAATGGPADGWPRLQSGWTEITKTERWQMALAWMLWHLIANESAPDGWRTIIGLRSPIFMAVRPVAFPAWRKHSWQPARGDAYGVLTPAVTWLRYAYVIDPARCDMTVLRYDGAIREWAQLAVVQFGIGGEPDWEAMQHSGS